MRKKRIPPLQSYCLVSMCIPFSFALGSVRHAVPRIQTHIETKHDFNTTLAFKSLK